MCMPHVGGGESMLAASYMCWRTEDRQRQAVDTRERWVEWGYIPIPAGSEEFEQIPGTSMPKWGVEGGHGGMRNPGSFIQAVGQV